MKARYFCIALGALAFAALPAGAQDRERDRDRDDDRRDLTSKLDTTVTLSKGGTVDLSLVSGEIIVTAGTSDQVRIHATSERGILQFSTSASRVSLSVRSQRGHMGDTRYEVSVPVGASLVLKAVSGDISAHGVNGELEAGSVSGDLDISGAKGNISLEAVSGDITAELLNGDVRVNAVSGDISLTGVVGPLEVETVSGELKLDGIKSKSVRTETVSGELEYDGSLDADGRYEFHSQSGDVRLHVPSSAGATVRVETFSGSVESDFPMTMQPGDHGTGPRPKRLEFSFNGGGARLTVESFSGDITIEKSGSRP
jgi:DUF4097 and DUF4098 domain-containing protein YvlB